MTIAVLGIELAKNVFQLCGSTGKGIQHLNTG